MIELSTLPKNAVSAPGTGINAIVSSNAGLASQHLKRTYPEHVPTTPIWQDSLALVERHVQFTRRRMLPGAAVQLAGEAFTSLHIVKLGIVKAVALSANGREQVVGLYFPGDWIGFDGIASGLCGSDALALETCEVWSLRYEGLLRATGPIQAILHTVCVAISAQLARDCEWRFAICTQSADARIANFVLTWVQALSARGLRTDQIALHLTRSEIGSFLGMTLETVSRSFSRLDRYGLIRFENKGRRYFAVPCVAALMEYARNLEDSPERKTLQ